MLSPERRPREPLGSFRLTLVMFSVGLMSAGAHGVVNSAGLPFPWAITCAATLVAALVAVRLVEEEGVSIPRVGEAR